MTATLKKISVDQVRVGMYLHALEGAWIDHPFWKNQFVIGDAADLRKLRDSKIREVWIDAGKGLDTGEPMAAPVLGGLLIADEVIDVFLPVLFYHVRARRWKKLHATTPQEVTEPQSEPPSEARSLQS